MDRTELTQLLSLCHVLTETLSHHNLHRASIVLSEWLCIVFHALDVNEKVSIYFHTLRSACAAANSGKVGYTTTILMGQVAKKVATWMAKPQNENNPANTTTAQHEVLLVAIFNRYLHHIERTIFDC